MTRRVLLRCDSTRDLYPVMAPSSIPHVFLVSQHTWHRRLRHLGREVLCHLVSNNFISCNKEKPPVLCHACQLGKHVRLPFVSSNAIITSCFDIIHSDVWTSPIPSLLGFKYYVLVLDHYSQFVWVYPLHNKSDCDHGGEFDKCTLHKLFADNGIQFRFSCPKTSQQNVIMEYLLKISKKAHISKLKQRHLKITVLTSNTPYPSRKIRRICACTSLKTTKDQGSIRHWKLLFFDSAVSIDAADLDAASTVFAACIVSAGICFCCYSILLLREDLSRNLELTESTPIVPADYVSAGHKKYDIEILDMAHMDNCNLSRTPIDNEYKLGSDGDPVSIGVLQVLYDTSLLLALISFMEFSRCIFICMILGSLIFLALKWILRYIRGTFDYGLQLFSSFTTDLVAYSDADWAGCPTTRRSTSCYCVFLDNNLLSWSSKRQPTLSRSSVEAEYCGVANAVAETCWLRNLLRELHTPLSSAMFVYCDNVSAVYLACNPVQHQRTKHIEIDIHFFRDLVTVGQVRVLHVSSRYRFADIFTKGLPSTLFEEFHSRFSFLRVSLFLVLLMERKGVLIDWEELLRGDIRGETIVGDDSGLPQSPLVSSTAPLPLHQSNVDVAPTFGVSLSTVGDLKVLITDINAGKYGELLSRMTNDKCKIVFDVLGDLCDLIKAKSTSRLGSESDGSSNESNAPVTMHTSSLVEEVLIHSIDDAGALFGVPLNFSRILMNLLKILKWDTLLNLKKSEASPSDTIVQSVDINTKSTSYAGAAGASAKDQPKVNSNFRHLVAGPVFYGVNISIPRKVVKNVSTRFEHTLYGYFIGKRMAFLAVEYYAKNNWAKHGLKRIMMNSKGFFFFKFNSHDGLEAVLEGGPWLIRKSSIILKKWSMDARLLKEELTRIPIWIKLHDVRIQVFEEDGISLVATFIGKPVMLD
ncbi:ribonuclease H-like domain-containing protein [Tanacetum coccineum]